MANRKDVFTIVKREGQEKGWWVKIGSAFVNKDDSISVYLDAFPVNGQLNIRDPKERDEDAPRSNRSSNQSSRRGDDF